MAVRELASGRGEGDEGGGWWRRRRRSSRRASPRRAPARCAQGWPSRRSCKREEMRQAAIDRAWTRQWASVDAVGLVAAENSNECKAKLSQAVGREHFPVIVRVYLHHATVRRGRAHEQREAWSNGSAAKQAPPKGVGTPPSPPPYGRATMTEVACRARIASSTRPNQRPFAGG